MKRVKWELDTPNQRYEGDFEIEDDATAREIDRMVRYEILNSEFFMYDWHTEEND